MRVLLADDQAKVRSALALLLTQEPDVEVVGEIGEVERLLTWVQATHPDLILLDWELPGDVSSNLFGILRAMCPRLKIIALSGLPEARQAALSAGADGFISKGDPPERLLATLYAVCGGGCDDDTQDA
jgi:DNA-binding NarL/FixJ family response regulator